jgi:hypothetical protein
VTPTPDADAGKARDAAGPPAAREPRRVDSPVVVGSASRDLTADDARGWRLGGAVTYAGLVLARLGFRPRVLLGIDAVGASARELDLLREAGAELAIVPLDASPVFENIEAGGGRTQRCVEPGSPIRTEALPAPWRSAGQWLLGPVADELPGAWAHVPAAGAHVALGWQGLLRELPRGGTVRRRPPGPSPILARADTVVVSRLDLAPETDVPALGSLLRPRATLVVTDGDAGGTEWQVRAGRASIVRRYPAIPSEALVDPTGAGDAFLAGLVAARLGFPGAAAGGSGAHLRLAAALGSLTVEGPGVQAIPTADALGKRLVASLTRR